VVPVGVVPVGVVPVGVVPVGVVPVGVVPVGVVPVVESSLGFCGSSDAAEFNFLMRIPTTRSNAIAPPPSKTSDGIDFMSKLSAKKKCEECMKFMSADKLEQREYEISR
jgi:hypothetical protein